MTDAGTAQIARAARSLRDGALVAFPTETVYGLGADASSPAAVARLYAVKGRPPEHPVIVHFATVEEAFGWASEPSPAARTLARAFWPGPLTLIVRRAAHVGDFVTGGQHTVGLRVPSHPVAQALLRAFSQGSQPARGIAAPSANRFGAVSATDAAHVQGDFGDTVDLVLEGGPSEVGIESTIVDVSRDAPVLLRPGAISAAALLQVLGASLAEKDAQSPRHSGGLARHYAPRTAALEVSAEALAAELERRPGRLGVLSFAEPDPRALRWIRMPREAPLYARQLYRSLRELDACGAEALLIEMPPEDGEWAAVHDRLRRATA